MLDAVAGVRSLILFIESRPHEATSTRRWKEFMAAGC